MLSVSGFYNWVDKQADIEEIVSLDFDSLQRRSNGPARFSIKVISIAAVTPCKRTESEGSLLDANSGASFRSEYEQYCRYHLGAFSNQIHNFRLAEVQHPLNEHKPDQ